MRYIDIILQNLLLISSYEIPKMKKRDLLPLPLSDRLRNDVRFPSWKIFTANKIVFEQIQKTQCQKLVELT